MHARDGNSSSASVAVVAKSLPCSSSRSRPSPGWVAALLLVSILSIELVAAGDEAPAPKAAAPKAAAPKAAAPKKPAPKEPAPEEPAPEPSATSEPLSTRERITGRTEERHRAGDDARDFGDAMAFLPRNALEYFFLAHAIAARFAFDRHLVPTRGRDGASKPTILIYPTLFAETGRPLDIGVRMVTEGGPFATSHRVGFGGVRDLVAESQVQATPVIGVVHLLASAEGLVESKSQLEYFGVGQTPRTDPRNHFVAQTPYDSGLYQERRTRAIVGFGVVPHPYIQLFHSAGFTRRQLSDEEDVAGQTISEVFEPSTVTTWGADTWLVYLETAGRLDTRPSVGGPTPGFMAETYGGYAHDFRGSDISFARVGGRVAGFIPIYRDTNILSPKVVLDGVVDVNGTPFTELAQQPDYRGTDNRRDNVSLVGSLDYMWAFASFAALRLFVDAATVGPAVESLPLDQLRVAAGGGIDIFSRQANIMRLWLAGSVDGFHAHLGIGSPSRFGDRQHRD